METLSCYLFLLNNFFLAEKAQGAHAASSDISHAATIEIDLHRILDLIKLELHAMEGRITSAQCRHHHGSDSSASSDSYRTASRQGP